MISLCITILVYIPIHVGALSYSKDVICSFLYVFVATVQFACIFGPKIYIVLFRPNKNVPMEISNALLMSQTNRISSDYVSMENSPCLTGGSAKKRRLNLTNDISLKATQHSFRKRRRERTRTDARVPKKEQQQPFKSTNVQAKRNLVDESIQTEEIKLEILRKTSHFTNNALVDNHEDGLNIYSSNKSYKEEEGWMKNSLPPAHSPFDRSTSNYHSMPSSATIPSAHSLNNSHTIPSAHSLYNSQSYINNNVAHPVSSSLPSPSVFEWLSGGSKSSLFSSSTGQPPLSIDVNPFSIETFDNRRIRSQSLRADFRHNEHGNSRITETSFTKAVAWTDTANSQQFRNTTIQENAMFELYRK